MKRAVDDIESRRPVWAALSTLFLDTDVSLDRDYRAKVLAASPYSIDELTQILASEVYPVCRWNLFSIAGEWAGFDPEWLEKKILRRLSRRLRLKGGWTLGRVTVHLSLEWENTRSAVNALREGVRHST